jgi:hypothetical protein
MGVNIGKALAIEKLQTERRRLEQNLAQLSENDMLQTGVVGEWSVKDVLAHLADWEQRFLDWYAADQRGEVPHPPAPGLTWKRQDLDTLNRQIFEKHHDRPLPEILAEFRDTHERLMATVQAIPEKDIVAETRFVWIGKSAMYHWLTAYASHDRWAKDQVRKRFKSGRPSTRARSKPGAQATPVKQLSQAAFERARDSIKTQARPLDRALFEYRFEQAPTESVLARLAHFQNGDGGFGHGLEPDVRTPASSALATGIGLRLLKELGCPADHPMVRQAVEFLLATFDASSKVWRVVPTHTNEFPHAPWWHDESESLARTFDGFRIIPRAEIVGLLYHYATLVPTEWLNDVTESTVACLETVEKLGTGGGDDIVYALSLAETEELPEHLTSRLVTRIRGVTPNVVSRDPQQWSSYCIAPLKLATSPRSIVADLLGEALQAHLDYQIEHQTPEGTWEPTWNWGKFYPEAWEQAKQEWRGSLTLDTLTTLRAFDRI